MEYIKVIIVHPKVHLFFFCSCYVSKYYGEQIKSYSGIGCMNDFHLYSISYQSCRQVLDTGSAFYGKGHSRIDICVRNQALSYDDTINGHLTLVFP